jgi:uncharacterized lipoprotein YbaY
MAKLFTHFLLPVFLLFTAGCTESYTAENAITGQLKLRLHQQKAIGLYARFDLLDVSETSQKVVIASSGFKKITEDPIDFSLAYLPEKINQQKQYRFFATISENSQGENKLASMSVPVLTQGHPSTLNMVIQPMVEPIE